jgi:replication initiation and membrane attachment protein DnaB
LEALACTGDIQVLWFQQRSPKRETANLIKRYFLPKFLPYVYHHYPPLTRSNFKKLEGMVLMCSLSFWLN